MYIGLSEDKAYKIFKTEEDMFMNTGDYKYLVFDCGSKLKGPLHTMIRKDKLHSHIPDINIKIDMDYVTDLPFNSNIEYTMNFQIDSFTKLYSIASLCYQYEAFNHYMAYMLDYHSEHIDTALDIEIKKITLDCPNIKSKMEREYISYDYSIACASLRKFLNQHHMDLCCNRFFGRQVTLFWNGKYLNMVEDPKDFKKLDWDMIGIPVTSGECFYIISRKKYERFKKLKSIDVEIGIEEYSLRTGTSEKHPCLEFNVTNEHLYDTMLFIPQYLLLKDSIQNSEYFMDKKTHMEEYGKYMNLEIEFGDGVIYNISASEKDIKSGISLYKIINQLTKI